MDLLLLASSGSQACIPKAGKKSLEEKKYFEEDSVTTNMPIDLNSLTLCHGKYKYNSKLNIALSPQTF